MGEIYRARDIKLHRDVALKVLPVRRHCRPPQRVRNFEAENRRRFSRRHAPRCPDASDGTGDGQRRQS
jgi:hypothetical protein